MTNTSLVYWIGYFTHWKKKNPAETPYHGWQRAGKTWQPSAIRGRERLPVVRETDVWLSQWLPAKPVEEHIPYYLFVKRSQ